MPTRTAMNPTRWHRAVVTALVLTLSGTSATACIDKTVSGPETPRARWEANSAKDYSFVSAHSCECVPNFAAPLRVTVRNNAVTTIVVDATGQAVPLNYRPTIDGLFDFIDRERQSRPSLLEVTYDATLGYPTRVKYGNPDVDAGGIITVTALTITR